MLRSVDFKALFHAYSADCWDWSWIKEFVLAFLFLVMIWSFQESILSVIVISKLICDFSNKTPRKPLPISKDRSWTDIWMLHFIFTKTYFFYHTLADATYSVCWMPITRYGYRILHNQWKMAAVSQENQRSCFSTWELVCANNMTVLLCCLGWAKQGASNGFFYHLPFHFVLFAWFNANSVCFWFLYI